jgi:hypothetical protein
MNVRKTITGAAMAGALTVGGFGAVVATGSAATAAPTKPSADCVAAFKKLAHEVAVDHRLRHDTNDLIVLRHWASTHHHPALVTKLSADIAKAKAAEAKLATTIKAQVAIVKTACKPATTPAG